MARLAKSEGLMLDREAALVALAYHSSARLNSSYRPISQPRLRNRVGLNRQDRSIARETCLPADGRSAAAHMVLGAGFARSPALGISPSGRSRSRDFDWAGVAISSVAPEWIAAVESIVTHTESARGAATPCRTEANACSTPHPQPRVQPRHPPQSAWQ